MKKGIVIKAVVLFFVIAVWGCVQSIEKTGNTINSLTPAETSEILADAQKNIEEGMAADQLLVKDIDAKYRMITGYNDKNSYLFFIKKTAVKKSENILIDVSKKITSNDGLVIKAFDTKNTETILEINYSNVSNSVYAVNKLQYGKYSLKVFVQNKEIANFEIIVIDDLSTQGINKISSPVYEDSEYIYLYGLNFVKAGMTITAKNNETGSITELKLITANSVIAVVQNTLSRGNYSVQVKESNNVSLAVAIRGEEKAIITKLKEEVELNEPLVIQGYNLKDTSIVKAIAENGSESILSCSAVDGKILIINNNLSVGKYSLKIVNGDVESQVKPITVVSSSSGGTTTVSAVIPKITKVANVAENEKIVIEGSDFNTNNIKIIITNSAGVSSLAEVINSSQTRAEISNGYTIGEYSAQVFSNAKYSNKFLFTVSKSTIPQPLVPIITSVLDIDQGADIVVNGSNIDITTVKAEINGQTGLVIKSSTTTKVIITKVLPVGQYTIKLLNGTTASNSVTFNVKKVYTAPIINNIASIDEGTDIIVTGTNIDVSAVSAVITDSSQNQIIGTIKNKTSTTVTITNIFMAGDYTVKLLNGTVESNIKNLKINKVIVTKPPTIVSVADVFEGDDIMLLGTDIDTATVKVEIIEANSNKTTPVIISKTLNSLTITNNYAPQALSIQIFNGTTSSNKVTFTVKKKITAPIITSVADVEEGADIVVNGSNIDTTIVSAEITDSLGGKTIPVIKTKTATSVTLTNNYTAQNLTIKLLNGIVGSNSKTFAVKAAAVAPIITSIPNVDVGGDISITGSKFDISTVSVKAQDTVSSAITILTIKTKSASTLIVSNTLSAGSYIIKVLNGILESNPVIVTINQSIQKVVYKITSACRTCGRCTNNICPQGAIKSGNPYVIDATKCTGCGACYSWGVTQGRCPGRAFTKGP